MGRSHKTRFRSHHGAPPGWESSEPERSSDTGTIWLGLGLHAGWNLGAYLLKEGDPALVRLTADLPTGWGGWSDWVSVAGNAVLLVATLVLTRRRRASVGELSRMRQRS